MSDITIFINRIEYKLVSCYDARKAGLHKDSSPIVWIDRDQYIGVEIKKENDIPKDWEILSFYSDMSDGRRNVLSLCTDGNYKFGIELINFSATIYECLNKFKIHSVKRLSDSELFVLGDKINHGVIGEITVAYDKCYIHTKDNWYPIGDVEKVKTKALFTTEDGVKVFEDNDYWQVEILPPTYTLHEARTHGNSKNQYYNVNSVKKFKHKEKAQEYILQNKPQQVTFDDVVSLFTEKEIYPYGVFRNKLKEFFKSKINQ